MSKEIKRILDYLLNEKAYLHYGIPREKFIELEGREVKTLLDYITNLQQENERLKEENILLKASEPMSKIAEDYGYKSRCEKAIEEIKRVLDIWENKPNEIATLDLEYLLNILTGGDD